jgi:hypothetical protein
MNNGQKKVYFWATQKLFVCCLKIFLEAREYIKLKVKYFFQNNSNFSEHLDTSAVRGREQRGLGENPVCEMVSKDHVR